MTTRVLDVPVFDADNHLYETRDSLTKYLPDRYRGVIDYVDVRGRTKIVVRGQISEYIPNPTFEVVARPGAQEEYFRRSAIPRARAAGRSSASRCVRSRRSASPAARLELMDEQGLDRALMFPTWPAWSRSGCATTPSAIHAVVHALNEWIHETWQFDYEGRIFTTPVISLPIVEQGHRGARVGGRAGRQGRADPARAGAGLPRPRSFGLPEFDPFWEKVVEHDVLVAMHSSDSGYERYTNDWMGSDARCCRSSRRRSACSRRGGRSRTRCRPSCATGPCPASRRSRSPSSRTAAAGSSRCSKNMADVYKKMPQDFPEDPVAVIKRNIYISPFWEEDLGELAELIGADHVLFGSDYPHPEGLADPVSYVNELDGLPEETVRKIMGGNLARLMNVDDTVAR